MLGKAMLTTMFDYNAAMNARILDRAANLSDAQLDAPEEYSRGGIRGTLWHTLIVEYGWRSQCQGIDARQQPPPLEPTASIAALEQFQKAESEQARAYIAGLSEEDFAETITLKRRDGTERTLVRWQILIHILYHSAQHRSELAELLTRSGQSPGDTDFFFFV